MGCCVPAAQQELFAAGKGTAGSDAGEGVMGSVSCGFNREKMRNYCAGSKRWYSEIRQKLKRVLVWSMWRCLPSGLGRTSGCCSSIPGLRDKVSGQPLSFNLPFYRDV